MGKGQDTLTFVVKSSRIGLYSEGIEVGYLLYSLDKERGIGEVDIIRVHDTYQGQGFGHALAKRIVEVAKEEGVDKLLMLIVNPLTAHIFCRYGRLFLTSMWGTTHDMEVGEKYFQEACVEEDDAFGPNLWVRVELF